ncbi:MAG: ParA family protein [Gammaproteobacteria bacterium]|nr:ParA family protein [Gammaproteobacteria bacterium]
MFSVKKSELVNNNVRQNTGPVEIEDISSSEANKSARIITICNQKGGVAKTTTCLNLGVSLSLLQKRVLLVDFDIQANLTLLMGYKDARSFFDLISTDDGNVSKFILKTKLDVWLLPSNSKMTLLSKKHLQQDNFELLLKESLSKVSNYFDYIIIDTPPSGDFYTLNALMASDIAIIPTPCDYLSMQGVSHIVNMIDVIAKKSGHIIDYKIPVTMFDSSSTASSVILDKLKSEHGGHLFRTRIERDDNVRESQIVHTPTIFYSKESAAGQQYYELAREIAAM